MGSSRWSPPGACTSAVAPRSAPGGERLGIGNRALASVPPAPSAVCDPRTVGWLDAVTARRPPGVKLLGICCPSRLARSCRLTSRSAHKRRHRLSGTSRSRGRVIYGIARVTSITSPGIAQLSLLMGPSLVALAELEVLAVLGGLVARTSRPGLMADSDRRWRQRASGENEMRGCPARL